METISYYYSRRNSIVTIAMMVILGVLFTSNIYNAYYSNDGFNLVLFGVLVMLLVFILVIVIFKRLLPALRKEIILEFNETELIDYLRNITVNWQDIQWIDFRRTRSSSMMILRLKWESDYGNDITIPLRWVEGKDSEIYNDALTCLERFNA